MPGTTYSNTIQREEVTMGLEHVLIAPEGTPWTPIARIDPSSPPPGFIHMGAVQDDTPRLAVTKNKFQLYTGIPRGLSYEQVLQLAGELTMVFHSISNQKAFAGSGGIRPLNIAANSGLTVGSGTNTRTSIQVSGSSALLPYMQLVTDSAGSIGSSLNIAYVASINAASGVVVLSGDGFPQVPVTGQPLWVLDHTEFALGTNVTPYFHMLGVADLTNGGQVIHDFQRVTPRGQWEERLAVGTDVRMPAVFDLFTYPTTKYGYGTQLIVGERFVFPGTQIA